MFCFQKAECMEGKIGDLGTARLLDPRRQSRMTIAPGTIDFMPPEALKILQIFITVKN